MKAKMVKFTCDYASPVGNMVISSDGEVLTGLWFSGQKYAPFSLVLKSRVQALPIFEETKRWLDCYFRGVIPDFTLEMWLDDTPFRLCVWKILREIPYGTTVSYEEVSRRLMKERGVRTMATQAVGGAIGHNPISLIIPCHRVVGADGDLTGYAAGIDRKRQLLKLEGVEMDD